MRHGIITKVLGGFYYVSDETGTVFTCKLRGKLKRRSEGVLVGDRVSFQIISGGEGVVEDILPRRNSLFRPKIANVDQGLIIMAAQDPDPDFLLLDRLLLLMQKAGIRPAICLNKTDLLPAGSPIYEQFAFYEQAGFPLVFASAETGRGRETLKEWLCGKITVLAGPSGAGKSSTLNLQNAELALETGSVSEKLGRGRHTTRCVELLQLDGGWVADTPGFSRLDLPTDLQAEELGQWYPEFRPYAAACYYDGCRHDREPDCGVKAALAEGKISAARYERYLILLRELMELREKEYK